MGWAFAASALGGTDIGQAVMGYQASQAQAAGYKAMQEQDQFNAKSEEIAADQAEAARRQDLNDTLSAIDAVRTSRGLDVASPTGMAIRQGITQKAEASINTDRLNYLTKAQSDLLGGWTAGQNAGIASEAGDVNLLSSAAKAATQFAGDGFGGDSTGSGSGGGGSMW